MLERTEWAVFHGRGKRLCNGSSAQSQPIANGTDIVVLVGSGSVVSIVNIMSAVSVVSIGTIVQFGRWAMICISDGGNVIDHRRE